jgi:hypothetical protein
MVLLQDAVVNVVLVLSLLEMSLCWAMVLLQAAVVIVVLVLSVGEASAW